MSPDLEWRVDDPAGEQTIAKTSAPRPPRWRKWAIGLVVMLGIGLGVLYRSIPEPARPVPTPLPTLEPTPTPPAVPAKLYAAIDREAQALADGDLDSYMAMNMPRDASAQGQLRNELTAAWGRPENKRPYYTIIDYNLRSQTKAWADIRQYRNGRWFRETRFYERKNGERWLRSDPDPFFWSELVETLDTLHLHVIYAVEDRELIPPIVAHLETLYASLCDDLDCPATDVTYTLALNSGLSAASPLSGDGRTIVFASPRVMGVYEDGQPIGAEGRNLVFLMAASTAQRTTGRNMFAPLDSRGGDAVLWMIPWWASEHALNLPFDIDLTSFQNPLPLADLWAPPTEANQDVYYREAYTVVRFIAQQYGPYSIGKLLKAVNPAKSFADAIENGLGVPFVEFDEQWQTWLKRNERTGP